MTEPDRIHLLDQALALIAITDGIDKAKLVAVAVETWLDLAKPPMVFVGDGGQIRNGSLDNPSPCTECGGLRTRYGLPCSVCCAPEYEAEMRKINEPQTP